MVILRSEGILLASFVRMFSLSDSEKESLIEDALAEYEIENVSLEEKNLYLRKYILLKFEEYTNAYIESFLSDKSPITKIMGEDVKLYKCPCCSFKSLKCRGEYFICSVCYWEDDGNEREDVYSNPNKMTLKEAKENFLKYGVVEESLLKIADGDRMIKYARSPEE